MPIRWSTFITDADGIVEYDRCKSFVSILLALAGGAVMLAGAVLELTRAVELPTQMIVIMGTVLVAPITGGMIAGMFGKHLQAQAVASATANAMVQSTETRTP